MSSREATRGRIAVFLDRDGTIIDDTHYIANPDLVRLRPGSAMAIAKLNRAAIPVIVVTNQSGIARGLLTESDYERVQERVATLLSRDGNGAHVDASYMCPHHPEFDGDCECRKPGTLLFRRAANEHGLDVARSTYIGDRWRDVAPGLSLGGHGILIGDEHASPDDLAAARAARVPVVPSLHSAVERFFSTFAPEGVAGH